MLPKNIPNGMPKPGQYLIEDALKLIGFGKLHYKVTFLSGIISLALINQLVGMMILMTASQCDLKLSTEDKGLLTSMSFIGLMIPAFMWGYLSDTRGRRTIMLLCLKWWIAVSFVSSFAPTFIVMLVSRFFTGFFVSGVASCFFPYISEFTPIEKRSAILAWVMFIGSAGYLYTPLVSWGILSLDFSWEVWEGFEYRPWRLILIMLILPTIVAVIILNGLPESPKFLLCQGRRNRALRTIHWIYEYNTGNSSLSLPVQELLPEPEYVSFKVNKDDGCLGICKKIIGQILPILKPPLVCNFFILSYIQVSLFSVGLGSTLWFTEIQNRLSKSSQRDTVCDIINLASNSSTINSLETTLVCEDQIEYKTYINTIVFGSFAILGLFTISILIKPLGRGTILFLWLFVSSLCGLALQWVAHPYWVLVLYSMFLTLSLTAISVANGAVVILFPTNVRSTVLSLVAMFGRLSSSLTSIVIGITIESYCNHTFGIITGLVAVASLLTLFLPIKKLNQ